jgi:aldehyde:ferredoxin oxidoreductase
MVVLVEDMARNRGLGGLLAQGVDRAAAALGRGAEEFAFTIKGQEIPFHDGRGKGSVALGMAVSPTGADHIEAPHETPFQGEGASMLGPLGILESQEPSGLGPAKVRYFKAAQLSWAMNNTIGLCNFTAAPLFGLSYAKLVEVVGAVTGWESSLYELFQAAERSITMARLFNNREGFGPDDDRLFRRMHEPMASGPGKGNRVDPLELARAVRLYYQAMGWDDQGRPLEGKLAELGLDWAATC